MIEPERGCNGTGLPSSQSLGGGQEHLFLYADVGEKPSSKLPRRAQINRFGMNHSRLPHILA